MHAVTPIIILPVEELHHYILLAIEVMLISQGCSLIEVPRLTRNVIANEQLSISACTEAILVRQSYFSREVPQCIISNQMDSPLY